MPVLEGANWLLIPFQILLVDLLLGADNALVIALACRSLPPTEVRRAATIGIGGAIALRLLMTVVATSLLTFPLVKLIGALVLIGIALNLADGDDFADTIVTRPRAATRMWTAAAIIVVADAAMSVDNVVALAAIARGSFWLLAIGVALSLPILVYGGLLLTHLLRRAPGLVTFGAVLLGWIAGDMAITDPLIAPWAYANAPGLVAIAPALGAAFVFFQSRGARAEAPKRAIESKPAPRPVSTRVVRAPEPPPKLEPLGDATPEPEGRVEAPRVPASAEDRIAIIGVLLLAIAAGAILMFASYYDSFN